MEDIVRKKGDAMQFLSYDDDDCFKGRETGRDQLVNASRTTEGLNYTRDPETYQVRDADEGRGISIMYRRLEHRASDDFRWG